MSKGKTYQAWTLVGSAVCVLLGLVSCNPAADDTRSGLLLFIDSINDGAPLESDVLTDEGIVEPDDVTLSLTSTVKNPEAEPVPTQGWGSIRLTSFSIVFTRPDGRNTPGVDVPYSITGAMTEVLPAPGSQVTTSLRIVTQLAKVEPPLRNLWYNEGELMIQVIANISIFGEDFANNAVRADGALTVYFADFAG